MSSTKTPLAARHGEPFYTIPMRSEYPSSTSTRKIPISSAKRSPTRIAQACSWKKSPPWTVLVQKAPHTIPLESRITIQNM